jgi:peptide/nickel transport system permease protein
VSHSRSPAVLRRSGQAILTLWALAALTGALLDLAPEHIDLDRLFAAPSLEDAWLGRDELGRSVLARLVDGAGRSAAVVLVVVPATALLGTLLGVSAAWTGGAWRALVRYLIEVWLAFPGLLAAIALAGVLGSGLHSVAIALVATGWTSFARLSLLIGDGLVQREHVAAARCLGRSPTGILRQHVLPFLAVALKVETRLAVAAVLVGEASLSFLGLGVQPPAASWGAMIRSGSPYLVIAPHLVLIPGAVLALVLLALEWVGRDSTGTPRRRTLGHDRARQPPARDAGTTR